MGYQYKVIRVSNRDGSIKRDSSLYNSICFIQRAKIGFGAVLVYSNGEEKVAKTSTVEDILVWDNMISITTKNTIYDLESIGGLV